MPLPHDEAHSLANWKILAKEHRYSLKQSPAHHQKQALAPNLFQRTEGTRPPTLLPEQEQTLRAQALKYCRYQLLWNIRKAYRSIRALPLIAKPPLSNNAASLQDPACVHKAVNTPERLPREYEYRETERQDLGEMPADVFLAPAAHPAKNPIRNLPHSPLREYLAWQIPPQHARCSPFRAY